MEGEPNGPFPLSFLQDTAPRPDSTPTPKAPFFNPGMTAMHSAFLSKSFGMSASGALTSSSTTFDDSQRRSAILSSANKSAITRKRDRIASLLFQNWYYFSLYRQTRHDGLIVR